MKRRSERIAKFEQMAATAAEELARLKSELAAPPAPPALELPDNIAGLALPQLDQLISKKQSELEDARTQLAACEAEPKNRAARRLDIPQKATAAREQISQLEEQLRSPAAEEPPAIASARCG